MKSVMPLKVRALRMDCHVHFRLQATFLYKRAEPARLRAGDRAQRLELKEPISVESGLFFCYLPGRLNVMIDVKAFWKVLSIYRCYSFKL